MAYEVLFTSRAEADLDKIYKYFLDNDFDLKKFAMIKVEIHAKLAEKPLSNLIYNEKRQIFKILVLRKNVVFYRVTNEKVRILRVKAGKMNVNL